MNHLILEISSESNQAHSLSNITNKKLFLVRF